jgi:MSHA biogenesis protein MshJ
MKMYWQTLQLWLDSKTVRERVMVVGVALLSIVAVIDLFIIEPQLKQSKALKSQLVAINEEINLKHTELTLLQGKRKINPDKKIEQEKATLLAEKKEIDQQIDTLSAHLLSTSQVIPMLKELLAKETNLKLIGLKNKPPEAMLNSSIVASVRNTSKPVYKHALALELQGPYEQVVHFLQSVESLSWGFTWEKVAYKVEQYPQGILRMDIYYLSNSKEWMGV